MRYYEKGYIPKKLRPNWGDWRGETSAYLDDLVNLSLDVDTAKLNKKYNDICEFSIEKQREVFDKRAFSHPAFGRSIEFIGDLEEQEEILEKLKEKENKLRRMCSKMSKAFNDLKKLLLTNIEGGYLNAQLSKDDNYKIKISDYIVWLDDQDIPYPKGLKNCANHLIGNFESLSDAKRRGISNTNGAVERVIGKLFDKYNFENNKERGEWKKKLTLLGKLPILEKQYQLLKVLSSFVFLAYGETPNISKVCEDGGTTSKSLNRWLDLLEKWEVPS